MVFFGADIAVPLSRQMWPLNKQMIHFMLPSAIDR
jgi:hypothetical protein